MPHFLYGMYHHQPPPFIKTFLWGKGDKNFLKRLNATKKKKLFYIENLLNLFLYDSKFFS